MILVFEWKTGELRSEWLFVALISEASKLTLGATRIRFSLVATIYYTKNAFSIENMQFNNTKWHGHSFTEWRNKPNSLISYSRKFFKVPIFLLLNKPITVTRQLLFCVHVSTGRELANVTRDDRASIMFWHSIFRPPHLSAVSRITWTLCNLLWL